mmetsp:Transcript_40662/g.62010  ORF Transcript_40662/g.62010 Transcript_40662/m.62010 type:complete len:82 (-) Transcript_40662:1149-1394(-)
MHMTAIEGQQPNIPQNVVPDWVGADSTKLAPAEVKAGPQSILSKPAPVTRASQHDIVPSDNNRPPEPERLLFTKKNDEGKP